MSVNVERTAAGFELTSSLRVPRGREEAFAFFSDAHNLERITPGFLKFRVLTPAPIELREGVLIDYALRVRGVPLRWRSEITVWDPPHRFVDRQVRGPYRRWVHEHRFVSLDGGDTLVEDRVEYAVPGGRLVHTLFVKRDVQAIFAYRTAVLREIFS